MSSVQRIAPGWILILSSLVGCQSIVQPNATVPRTAETIPVQIRPAHGKSAALELPLEPNMRLQDVVDKSRPKFRHQYAYIVRTSPTSGKDHKLEATFGPDRRISLETDYAVQPGDRVVITQDTRSSIERVMFDFLGRG